MTAPQTGWTSARFTALRIDARRTDPRWFRLQRRSRFIRPAATWSHDIP